ncbi:unnamed protein product [Schistosoma rodhaini]|nr:unnamed protein product [Schistosoma rodhaini]
MKQSLSNDLVEVLIKPNNMRTAIEIRHIAIWFKENIMAFKDVSIEILMKLVAECKAEFKYPHEIIIREGDIGDCMYVLLSGRVSVHYRRDQNAVPNEEIHELVNVKSNSFIPVKQNVSDTVNEELGPQVGQLAGSVFGEVALIEDCLRTASILALPNTIEFNQYEPSNQQQHEQQQQQRQQQQQQHHLLPIKQSVCLINISRILYNNTVRQAIEKEFYERIKYVKNIIYFQHLSDKIKKQIAMSLIKQTYEYNQIILKQNSIFNGLYFIQRGELRIELHVKHFQNSTTYRNNSRSVKYDLPLMNGSNPNTPEKTGSLCIGDLEFLFKYPKYLFTIISNTSNTIIYYMNIKNAQRYILSYYTKYNNNYYNYQSFMSFLTLYQFINLIQLRLINLIIYIPNNLKINLLNSFNNLLKEKLNNYETYLKFIKFKNLKNNLNLIKLKQFPINNNNKNYYLNENIIINKNNDINKLFNKNNQLNESIKKIKKQKHFLNFSNKINNLSFDLLITSENNFKTLNQNLLISNNNNKNNNNLQLNQLNQFINDNELKEIIHSNLPYHYKLNAGYLLEQLNNENLQIKIQNFIKNLNEFNKNQLNENFEYLNYYTIIPKKTLDEPEKSSLVNYKRKLLPSSVGMCSWLPNM